MINFSFIKDKLKLNKKRTMLRHLSLLIATLMLFSVAVWAWFALQETTEGNGLNMTLGTSKNLDMSLDGGATYHGSIDLLNDDQQKYISESNRIKDKLYMYDITSDGDTFLNPKFLEQTNGIRIPNTDSEEQWTTANPNSAYISETIKFRTTFPADIYMGKNTAITTSATTLVGATAGNKSEGGDFSCDCIVGALRISAVNSNNELCFVMIPRSDVELVQDGDTFSVNTGDSVSDSAKKHTYYPDNYKAVGGTVTNENTLLGFTAVDGGDAPGDNTKIATTVKSNDGYYYGTATVNIWLEGCDAETRRVLSGGNFNIALDFVAFDSTTE